MLQQKFFDAHLLDQSLALTESLDRFHSYINSQRLDEAKSEITKVAEQHPRTFVFKNMHWVETLRGCEEGQVYAARKLVDCDGSLENQYLLANTLNKSGAEREALDTYHLIIDQSSAPSWLLFSCFTNMGNIYLKMKDLDAAEEYFNKAYTIYNTDLNLLLSYGYLYLQNGNLNSSREKFTEVLHKDPSNIEAYVGISIVHATVGEFELACANLNQALEQEPEHKLAMYLHYQWSQQTAEFKAIEHIDAFLQLRPQDEEALTLKVGWYIKTQNYRKAYETLPSLKQNYKGNSRYISQLETYIRELM